jgi:hypothetical protein
LYKNSNHLTVATRPHRLNWRLGHHPPPALTYPNFVGAPPLPQAGEDEGVPFNTPQAGENKRRVLIFPLMTSRLDPGVLLVTISSLARGAQAQLEIAIHSLTAQAVISG